MFLKPKHTLTNQVENNTATLYRRYTNEFTYSKEITIEDDPTNVNFLKYKNSVYRKDIDFDFVRTTEIDNPEQQPIKGLKIESEIFDIKHYNDNLKLSNDDLVKVENKIYMVSNLSRKRVSQPKGYYVYYATFQQVQAIAYE